MSLALPAFGQKAAMESKLAGFGRSFRADIDAMIGKKLTCEGGRPRRRFNFRWFLTYPVSDRPIWSHLFAFYARTVVMQGYATTRTVVACIS